ncbi:MAG: hypothetical protein KDD58_09290 [Bdellovibrionales bacterium]|nr:hypothetical protein [Bdellovibrionales bacterium]
MSAFIHFFIFLTIVIGCPIKSWSGHHEKCDSVISNHHSTQESEQNLFSIAYDYLNSSRKSTFQTDVEIEEWAKGFLTFLIENNIPHSNYFLIQFFGRLMTLKNISSPSIEIIQASPILSAMYSLIKKRFHELEHKQNIRDIIPYSGDYKSYYDANKVTEPENDYWALKLVMMIVEPDLRTNFLKQERLKTKSSFFKFRSSLMVLNQYLLNSDAAKDYVPLTTTLLFSMIKKIQKNINTYGLNLENFELLLLIGEKNGQKYWQVQRKVILMLEPLFQKNPKIQSQWHPNLSFRLKEIFEKMIESQRNMGLYQEWIQPVTNEDFQFLKRMGVL